VKKYCVVNGDTSCDDGDGDDDTVTPTCGPSDGYIINMNSQQISCTSLSGIANCCYEDTGWHVLSGCGVSTDNYYFQSECNIS
jgi:hypothetical protein